MSVRPFEALRPDYEHWVAACKPRPECVSLIDAVAHRITRPEAMANFSLVQQRMGIPVLFTAPSFERECGCDFKCSPAQGDRWDQVSRHVPKGRGPFRSWYESAFDTYHNIDHLDVFSAPLSLVYGCYWWEKINGFGYRARGLRSPYVVGGSNLQQPGKYIADGEFDTRHMDEQLGCLPIAMRMQQIHPELSLGDALAIVAVADAPPLVPVPTVFGGSLTGTKWVQASLNVVLHLNPPLKVDGSYGRKTEASVRAFRVKAGLPESNRVDAAFCDSMDVALAAARPIIAPV